MSINITEYATCATCKGDFHDTELITMFVVFEDRPQMHPMLHHVECLECHHELHHKGDPNPETCGTLRDLRRRHKRAAPDPADAVV